MRLNKLKRSCIRKFFYKHLPKLNKISQELGIKKLYGQDIESLGIEKCYEIFEDLFRSEDLHIVATNRDDFIIYRINPIAKCLKVLYDTNINN